MQAVTTVQEVILLPDLRLNSAQEVKDVLLKVLLLKIALEDIRTEHIKVFVLLVLQGIIVQLMEEVSLTRKCLAILLQLPMELSNLIIVQIM